MDIALLLGLIVLNGLFAMAEIALVSSRKARLQKLADSGNSRAQNALKLHNDPSSFLATVQIGITAIGILSGAIGETILADPLAAWLANFAPISLYSKTIAITVVVIALTYLSVVVGELVPKQIGLRDPERIASLIASPMNMLSCIARPLVWLLASSSRIVLRALGASRSEEPPVTNEEINVLMGQGAEAGVFHESEQVIVSNVLRLDEQRIGMIMTHRSDVYMLDLNSSEMEIRQCLEQSPFSRIVVCRHGLDNVVGILNTGDILKAVLSGETLDIEKFLHPPLYVPESVTTTKLLEIFRQKRQQCALIVDEYGGLHGVVTLFDVLTSIVGDLASNDTKTEQGIIVREDKSLLVDGDVSIDRIKLFLELTNQLPGEADNAFNTIGGFMMHALGRVPDTADHFDWHGLRFEVMDMDKNRVDKLLIVKTGQSISK